MAFHHVTPFLRPAVRSILDQTFRDFEFLIVDNGTSAGHTALAEEGRDSRVRLIASETNLGVPASHNLARSLARGEFVANMDSDDIALPTRLEKQLAAFRAEPRLGVLSTHAWVVDEAGAELRPQFTLPTWEDQRAFSDYSLPVTNPTLMVRREIFEQFPMRPELPIASDYDFFTRAIEVYPCRALPEVLLHYRQHGDQVTVSRFALMVFCACITRLITARRRAGRPEGLPELLETYQAWMVQPPAPAESYAHFAGVALADGFPLLAVFLARRAVSRRRTAAELARATATLAAALRRDPADAGRLVSMFLRGPLKAMNLRPL